MRSTPCHCCKPCGATRRCRRAHHVDVCCHLQPLSLPALQEWLGEDLSFQQIEGELASLPGSYANEAGGCMLLAVAAADSNGGGQGSAAVIGAVALRRLAGHTSTVRQGELVAGVPLKHVCEMKRLFVLAEHHGLGAGAALVGGRGVGSDACLAGGACSVECRRKPGVLPTHAAENHHTCHCRHAVHTTHPLLSRLALVPVRPHTDHSLLHCPLQVRALLVEAAARGYSLMVLDTLERLEGANRLYCRLGFEVGGLLCCGALAALCCAAPVQVWC